MSAAVPDLYARRAEDALEPPVGFRQTLRFLGPGIILVGSVVGSGEIMMTTSLGATVGFVMLWWMLASCWGKSIMQAELGRYTVASGETLLHAFNHLPGKLPAARKKVSWFIYLWLFTLVPSLFGGGGIYGGTGQAVNAALPFLGSEWWTVLLAAGASALILTGTYRFLEGLLLVMVVTFTFVTLLGAVMLQFTPYAVTWEDLRAGLRFEFPVFAVGIALAAYGGTGVSSGETMSYTYWCIEKGYARFAGPTDASAAWARRARGWIRVMQLDVLLTLLMLTCATVPFYLLGAGVLYRKPLFVTDQVTPQTVARESALRPGTLRAAFLHAGVPLIEPFKIETQVAGRRWLVTDGPGDTRYALRWEGDRLAVFKLPGGVETILTLSQIYTETLGSWAWGLFMLGAFFVLYSTVISGLGAGARMFADGMGVLGFIDPTDYAARLRILRVWAVVAPAITATCYFFVRNPIWMLTISGTVSAMLTPILAGGILYLRYTRLDRRIAPTWKADAALWVCFVLVLTLAAYAIIRQFT